MLCLALSASLALTWAPLPTQQTLLPDLELSTSNTNGGDFGGRVALDGDHALVSMQEFGQVLLFDLAAGGPVQPLNATPQSRDYGSYGSAVDLREDHILIGSFRDDRAGPQQGRAFLYAAPAGDLIQELAPADLSPSDFYGRSVALGEEFFLVGAPGQSNGAPDSGAVYQYSLSTGAFVRKLSASDPQASGAFGSSLAVEGGRVLIGATGAEAAYLFDLSTGTELAKLVAPNAQPVDFFGTSVALQGDRAVVGAPRHDLHGSQSGTAYLFDLANGTVIEQLGFAPAGGGAWMGTAVALSEHYVVVGGRGGSVASPEGRAVVFDSASGALLAELEVPELSLDFGFAWFGSSLSISGGRVLVGAPFANVWCEDCFSDGGAYRFDLDSIGIESYCAGEGCPCANDDPTAGCQTSLGQGASLASTGTNSVAADDLILTATGLPPQQSGLIFLSGSSLSLPFGDGLRCVGGGGVATCRLPVQSSSSGGSIQQGPGLVDLIASINSACALSPGETWYFQGWFRDPQGPCGSGFNLTDALAIHLRP